MRIQHQSACPILAANEALRRRLQRPQSRQVGQPLQGTHRLQCTGAVPPLIPSELAPVLQTAAVAEQARQDAVAEAGPLREQLARLKREQQAAQKEKRDVLQRCKELSQEVATLHVSLPPFYSQG